MLGDGHRIAAGLAHAYLRGPDRTRSDLLGAADLNSLRIVDEEREPVAVAASRRHVVLDHRDTLAAGDREKAAADEVSVLELRHVDGHADLALEASNHLRVRRLRAD